MEEEEPFDVTLSATVVVAVTAAAVKRGNRFNGCAGAYNPSNVNTVHTKKDGSDNDNAMDDCVHCRAGNTCGKRGLRCSNLYGRID
jgi:hypothetical protein